MKLYQKADQIKLVHSGHNYFELLEDIINSSKKVLHIQTYIFKTDSTGLRIVNALKKAALRKVQIFIMLDAFGSSSFSRKVIHELREAGVQFRFFAPLFSSENIHIGRRLHYKIVVADKRVALTGGINIADKYSGNEQTNPWLDYAILTEGAVCEYLHLLCEQVFSHKNQSDLRKWENSITPPPSGQNYLIRYRLNDRLRRRDEIHKSYKAHIQNATKSITIIASYFLPSRTFRQLIATTSARGVKIRIVLTKESDTLSARLAESYLYAYYLRNKIQLFEWKNSVMHGKAMIVDEEWATIGSYNINFLSHYLSMELNTEVQDSEFAKIFLQHVDDIVENGCINIDLNKYGQTNNLLKKFAMWLAYNFFRILKNISVRKKNGLR